MKIKDNETDKIVSENYLRNLLLEFEIDDILKNWQDYKTEFLSIKSQCNLIKEINKIDIKELIWRLNSLWGTDFEIKNK